MWRRKSVSEMRASIGLSRRDIAAVHLGSRIVRSIVYRTRRALDPVHFRRWKRRVLFPIRNRLLRGKPITVRVDGEHFALAPEGAVAADLWSRLWFEKRELEFILRILRPDMVLVDAGANVGFFSIPAAKKLAFGKVYAFEPCQRINRFLKQNVELNGLGNVVSVPAALGDFIGEGILNINADGKDGLNTLGKPSHPNCEIVGEEIVPITTLDAFVRLHRISSVDVIKIDVEGAELAVFRGAADVLNGPRAPLIMYESSFLAKGFGYHPVECMWLLRKYDYSFFVIDPRTGKIVRPAASRAYNATVIAAKPQHLCYSSLESMAS